MLDLRFDSANKSEEMIIFLSAESCCYKKGLAEFRSNLDDKLSFYYSYKLSSFSLYFFITPTLIGVVWVYISLSYC